MVYQSFLDFSFLFFSHLFLSFLFCFQEATLFTCDIPLDLHWSLFSSTAPFFYVTLVPTTKPLLETTPMGQQFEVLHPSKTKRQNPSHFLRQSPPNPFSPPPSRNDGLLSNLCPIIQPPPSTSIPKTAIPNISIPISITNNCSPRRYY